MLLSDSKWGKESELKLDQNKSKQEAESRISIYGLQVTCKADFIRDFIRGSGSNPIGAQQVITQL
jgi:hypothetical protein